MIEGKWVDMPRSTFELFNKVSKEGGAKPIRENHPHFRHNDDGTVGVFFYDFVFEAYASGAEKDEEFVDTFERILVEVSNSKSTN